MKERAEKWEREKMNRRERGGYTRKRDGRSKEREMEGIIWRSTGVGKAKDYSFSCLEFFHDEIYIYFSLWNCIQQQNGSGTFNADIFLFQN